ncbi:45687_t:CDS:2, partial [Gigaspora margarita]
RTRDSRYFTKIQKDKAVAEYLGIQHIELVCIIREIIEKYDYIQYKIARGQQTLTEEMELLEIDKSQNRANKVPNQVLREKDTLLQDLQEKIARKNETTHLIEKEGPIDIEMLEKEKMSPIMANDTNKVEQLQDKLQNLVIQEENKKSYSTKIDCSVYDKGKKDIYESRWAPYNRTKVTTTTQTKTSQEQTV